MGNRSLLEINHDFSHRIKENPSAFVDAMMMFLRSNSPANSIALDYFGINVFGTRHHSDFYEIHWGGHYASEGKRTR